MSFKRNNPRSGATSQHGLAKRIETLALRFRQAMDQRDFARACVAAQVALRFVPRHMGILSDYAFCLMRLGQYKQSYRVYMKIYQSPASLQQQASPTWLDGLAEVCGWLGRRDDVQRYGKQSLERADAACSKGMTRSLPEKPPAFEGKDPSRNIISYTLFGDSPRYCESAITNIQVATELFPQWRCRVYLDNTVPNAVQKRLRAAGAQIVDMSTSTQEGVHPLMWRFLVIDDPEVDRFLIRDADSLLSEREKAAVEEWIKSPYWYHHIRDYFTHTELILAGLWGGCRGGLPPIKPLMQQWLAAQDNVTRFVDQKFLREAVWPTLRTSVLSHDEWFDFHGAQPFPQHPEIRWNTESFHVGSNASFQGIEGTSSKGNGELQVWSIVDNNGATVCSYGSIVNDGHWRADLPFFIVDNLSDQSWVVRVEDFKSYPA